MLGVVVLFGLYGLSKGLVRGALSLAGFALGAYVGARLAPAVLAGRLTVRAASCARWRHPGWNAALQPRGDPRCDSPFDDGGDSRPAGARLRGWAPPRSSRRAGALLGRRRGAPLLAGPVRAPAVGPGLGDPVADQRVVPSRAAARDARAGRSTRGARRPPGDRSAAQGGDRPRSRRRGSGGKRRPYLRNRLRSRHRRLGVDRAARDRGDERARRRRNRPPAGRSAGRALRSRRPSSRSTPRTISRCCS